MEISEYTCALSGKEARESELVADAREDDPLEDMPVGWLKVTVQRRVLNPVWEKVEVRKKRLLDAVKASSIPADAPDEVRQEHTADIELQFAAQYAALDAQLSKYLVEEEECYVRDPSKDTQSQKAWDELAGVLGIDLGVEEAS